MPTQPPASDAVSASDVRGEGLRLRDIGEDALLAQIFPLLAGDPAADDGVLVGPGDDTAVIAAPDARVVVTTDAMVRDHDWRDEWSSGADVGAKIVAQNVADVAAMGAVPTGLLVTLAADVDTPVAWALDLTAGLARAAKEAGTRVVGGDLSSAEPGSVMVCVTAFGDLQGRAPVRRNGARVGDVVAVTGTLGRAAAGLLLLQAGTPERGPECVAMQRAPRPPYEQGPLAAQAGAHAMIDLSDGLVRDAGRVARASGVGVDLHGAALRADVEALTSSVGADAARDCVLAGGEEHSLLACFAPDDVPPGWRVIGEVRAGSGVSVDGVAPTVLGWDHFGG